MFQRAARLPDYKDIQRQLGLTKEAEQTSLDDRLKAALMSIRPKPEPVVVDIPAAE